jgi:hypothetical protein
MLLPFLCTLPDCAAIKTAVLDLRGVIPQCSTSRVYGRYGLSRRADISKPPLISQ